MAELEAESNKSSINDAEKLELNKTKEVFQTRKTMACLKNTELKVPINVTLRTRWVSYSRKSSSDSRQENNYGF